VKGLPRLRFLLMALDGTSTSVRAKFTVPSVQLAEAEVRESHYFHSVVTPVIVCSGRSEVIPLVPEFIVPQDGHDKQDCEHAGETMAFAARRTTVP